VALHKSRIRLATIHEIKGETHEATMLVSASRRGNQSHWADWIGDKDSEAARLAYVASSRPKTLLVWAVKKLKTSERATSAVSAVNTIFDLKLPLATGSSRPETDILVRP
jgi:hypothetical protein